MDECACCATQNKLVCRINQNGIQEEFYCANCGTNHTRHHGMEVMDYESQWNGAFMHQFNLAKQHG